jgi:hypothetical protein
MTTTDTPYTPYIFVGERPSKRAEEIGATWQNGKLAAKQLHDALLSNGIAPSSQEYVNLWPHAAPGDADAAHEARVLALLQEKVKAGQVVIGMGAIVCRVLATHGILHRPMVHPAARGHIRAKARYAAHVREAIGLS